MGSNFAVVYACLFLVEIEDNNRPYKAKELVPYKRYIDRRFQHLGRTSQLFEELPQ
jgi:hypothetical protein